MWKIKTNNHPRDLVSLWELPENIRREDFDHISEDDGAYRFVQYRGSWYDVNDTQVIGHDHRMGWGFPVDSDSPLAAWDHIATDSAFSAVVFRYPTEHYCGRTDYGRRDERCERYFNSPPTGRCNDGRRPIYGRAFCEPDYERVVVGLALS